MEFQEVMRQWVRARKATASNLDENVLSVYPLEMYTDDHIANLEKEVMAWAAEHPEPVYPNWSQWLVSIGVIPKEIDISEFRAIAELGLIKPIPADIADKLGLEPKEG